MENTEWYQNPSGYGRVVLKVLLVRILFGWLDSLYFTKRLNRLTEVFFCLFVFFFALHRGNKPPHSCESRCRPASVSQMDLIWCYWLWTKSKAFCHKFSPRWNYEIFTLFMKALHKETLILFCLCPVSVCIIPFLKTCFICVHNILFLFFVFFSAGHMIYNVHLNKHTNTYTRDNFCIYISKRVLTFLCIY